MLSFVFARFTQTKGNPLNFSILRILGPGHPATTQTSTPSIVGAVVRHLADSREVSVRRLSPNMMSLPNI